MIIETRELSVAPMCDRTSAVYRLLIGFVAFLACRVMVAMLSVVDAPTGTSLAQYLSAVQSTSHPRSGLVITDSSPLLRSGLGKKPIYWQKR